MSNIANTNIYALISNAVINLLYGNIQTMQTQNNALEMFTETNSALTANWTTNVSGSAQTWLGMNNGHPPTCLADVQNIVTIFLQNGGNGLISSAAIVDLMGYVSKFWNATQSPILMQQLNQLASIVSAGGQNEEQIGQNSAKTDTSFLQTSMGASQGISDMGTSINGIVSAFAAALSQMF